MGRSTFPTDHETRILKYLDQHGGSADRMKLVPDLANPDSNLGRGIVNGSNGAVPMVMARWCKRLIEKGFVRQGFLNRYGSPDWSNYYITDAGKRFIRDSPND